MGVDHPGAHLPPPAPLLERNPLLFWQALCAVLSLIVLAPLLYIQGRPLSRSGGRPRRAPSSAARRYAAGRAS